MEAHRLFVLVATVGCSNGVKDQGVDARASPDAVARYCSATSHYFCDDFDDSPRPNVQGGWDTATTSGTGTLLIDPTTTVSQPQSLVMTAYTAGNGAPPDSAGMSKNLTYPYTTQSFTLSAELDATQLASNVRIMHMTWGVDVGGLFEMDVSNDSAYCAAGPGALGAYWSKVSLPPPPVGQWTPVSMQFAANTFTCAIGATSASFVINGWNTPVQAGIDAFPYSSAEMPATLRFDNVVVDLQ
jgi:hypothetical protein